MTNREEETTCEACNEKAIVRRGLQDSEARTITTFTTSCTNPECGKETVSQLDGDHTRT